MRDGDAGADTPRHGRAASLRGRTSIMTAPIATTASARASTGRPHGVARAAFMPRAAFGLRLTSWPVERLAQGRNTPAMTALPSVTVTMPSPTQSARENPRRRLKNDPLPNARVARPVGVSAAVRHSVSRAVSQPRCERKGL